MQNFLKYMNIISSDPGANSKLLAKNIIYCVMASELSLMSALCNNDLVRAHLKLNRGT